jgi:Zn-dependent M28 family amino/carboxypeptidase
MSATITEIAEYNLDNLVQYNLTPIEVIGNYKPNLEYVFSAGSKDPNVDLKLEYRYNSNYDIPSMLIGTEMKPIDTFSAVVNGVPGFTFTAS